MVPTRDSIFAGDDARQQQASMESMLKNTADGQNAAETEGAATHTNDGTLDSGHESTASSAQSSLTTSVSASNAAATEETKRQQNQNQLDVNHWLTEYYKPPPEGFASMAESKIDVS